MTEPLSEDPGNEGNDQVVSEGNHVEIEESDLEDAPEQDENAPEPNDLGGDVT